MKNLENGQEGDLEIDDLTPEEIKSKILDLDTEIKWAKIDSDDVSEKPDSEDKEARLKEIQAEIEQLKEERKKYSEKYKILSGEDL